MSAIIHKRIRESVLKTALIHQLRNGKKSPERTTRNILELLLKFSPNKLFHYDELLTLIKKSSPEECLEVIMQKIC
jgi:hypothetical protein